MQHSSKLMKKIRAELGMSQGELAMKLGYSSAQFVSNIERSKAGIPVEKFKKLSRITGKPVELFVETHLKDVRERILEAI